MHWEDEGYILAKNNFNENSIIIETFTSNHGKYSGIVYGGASRKQKKDLQIGNKILINWKSKNQNSPGYFVIELIDPIAPFFFDDKKRSICLMAATSILKILLPERQVNPKIYASFEEILNNLKKENWIYSYIYWELSLIKDLGFEIDLLDKKVLQINNREIKIPNLILNAAISENNNKNTLEALIFNKNLIIENFITPNKLRFPLFRSILEKYYT